MVNVQGDEPLIPPAVINQVAENLAQNEQAGVATLCDVDQAIVKDDVVAGAIPCGTTVTVEVLDAFDVLIKQ